MAYARETHPRFCAPNRKSRAFVTLSPPLRQPGAVQWAEEGAVLATSDCVIAVLLTLFRLPKTALVTSSLPTEFTPAARLTYNHQSLGAKAKLPVDGAVAV